MAAIKLAYILTFSEQEHQWMLFDGKKLSESEAPDPKNKYPVVALLPDHLFFFFKPKGVSKSRHAKSATLMQMNYSFPEQNFGFKVLRPSGGAVLGYTSHDLLDRFLDTHRDILGRATVLTSAFTVCWRAAVAEGLSVWRWKGREGMQILASGDDLTYFSGGEGEFTSRYDRLGLDGNPEDMTLEKACKVFADKKIKWARLNLISGTSSVVDKSVSIEFKPYIIAAILTTLIGLFFIVGQYHRRRLSQDTAAEWRGKLKEVYIAALGPAPGADPYGKILFKLDQLKSGGGNKGVDVLGLLSFISDSSPVGIEIEGINLGADSGNIRGKVSSYDDLDGMMEKLTLSGDFDFVLEQATNAPDGIIFSLRAEYNR